MESNLNHSNNGLKLGMSMADAATIHDILVIRLKYDINHDCINKARDDAIVGAINGLSDMFNCGLHDKQSTFDLKTSSIKLMLSSAKFAQKHLNLCHNTLRLPNHITLDVDKDLQSLIPKLTKYYLACKFEDVNPKQVFKELDHSMRIAKASFVREALDLIFKQTKVNHDTAKLETNSFLAGAFLKANVHHVLGKNKMFYLLDAVITGTKSNLKHQKLSEVELMKAEHELDQLEDLQKHHQKYVICTVNAKTKHLSFDKVSKANFLNLAHHAKQYLQANLK